MAQLFQNTILSIDGLISLKSSLMNIKRVLSSSDNGNSTTLVVYDKSLSGGAESTHSIIIDDTLSNVSGQLSEYESGRYYSGLIESKNNVNINQLSDIKVDDILFAYENPVDSSKTDIRMADGSKITLNETLSSFKNNVNRSGFNSSIIGKGDVASRNSQVSIQLGDIWINTETHVLEFWDGDLWVNSNGKKVRNQQGVTVEIGRPMKLDGTVDGSDVPDAIYTVFADEAYTGVVADAGGTYDDGDYLFIVNKGVYPVFSTTSLTVGEIIRTEAAGDTDGIATGSVGSFGIVVQNKGVGAGVAKVFLSGPERF